MIAPRPLLTLSVAAQVVVARIDNNGLGSVYPSFAMPVTKACPFAQNPSVTAVAPGPQKFQ